jgi:hypothetical protein
MIFAIIIVSVIAFVALTARRSDVEDTALNTKPDDDKTGPVLERSRRPAQDLLKGHVWTFRTVARSGY